MTTKKLKRKLFRLIKDLSKKDKEFIGDALELAEKKHFGQKRYEGDDYIVHPLRTAICLIEELKNKNPKTICSALLHDAVEDTDLTIKEIKKRFGKKIGETVSVLTRRKMKDGTREKIYQRKYKHFLKILKTDTESKMIKTCDYLDNIRSWPKIPENHPAREEFKRWFKEAKNIYLPLAKSINKEIGRKTEEAIKKTKEELGKRRKVHFIGIGGIGISALARYYLEKDFEVTGSDLNSSEITQSLERSGVQIYVGKHQSRNLSRSTDLVIYSNAVLLSNPELKKARKLKIRCQSYPEVLGELTKKHFTIAVSGAHGKGTTTAMISLILIEAGLDPTVIIGTKLKEFKGTNCRIGKSKYLIIEADEYKRAFLNYWPKIIVLTNIDREHLDYFKDINDIKDAFKEFVGHLPKNGILVVNRDSENIKSCNFSAIVKKLIYYSLKQREAGQIKKVLKIPGIHNISNALAALSLARVLKIPDRVSLRALSQYRGAWRRFETHHIRWARKFVTIVSDYAHHPTEIKATIQSAREKFKKRKIWVVFQPHQYQRTYYLFNEFVKAFDEADKIVLTKIYGVAGREKKNIVKKVNSEKLVREIKKRGKGAYFIKDFQKISQFLRERTNNNDVILIMGAGDINSLVSLLLQ